MLFSNIHITWACPCRTAQANMGKQDGKKEAAAAGGSVAQVGSS